MIILLCQHDKHRNVWQTNITVVQDKNNYKSHIHTHIHRLTIFVAHFDSSAPHLHVNCECVLTFGKRRRVASCYVVNGVGSLYGSLTTPNFSNLFWWVAEISSGPVLLLPSNLPMTPLSRNSQPRPDNPSVIGGSSFTVRVLANCYN